MSDTPAAELPDFIDLPQIDDLRSLFLNDIPMLDVRAPVEFEQGAFPHTDNVPLMNDQEREAIGICYKEHGQAEAITLGAQLIKDEIKEQRVDRWVEFVQQHPEGILYCFRGGMRSKISQQWIYERTGIVYPRVKGGYKAMRRFLIDELESSATKIKPMILSGRTGTGKTVFLQEIKQMIDLEGIYHHRGSVFGKHVTPQPTQIAIENQLSIELMKHLNQGDQHLLLEDESGNIGSRQIPDTLFATMKAAPVVVLETDIDTRIQITYDEYVTEALAEHQAYYGEEQGFTVWAQQQQDSLDRIQKRLGGVRYKELKSLLSMAIEQQSTGDTTAYKEWIQTLLVDYYDPMYDYQLSKKQERVVFKGSEDEVRDYLLQKYQID